MPVNKKAAMNNVRFLNPSSRQEKNPLKTDQQQPYRTAYLEHQNAITLSSELLPSGLFYEMPRQAKEEQRIKVPYKCTRCRNHGLIVPYRGHNCPCSTCVCEKCSRSTERTRLGNLQAKLKRREAKAQQLLQSQAKGEAESNTVSKSEDPASLSQVGSTTAEIPVSTMTTPTSGQGYQEVVSTKANVEVQVTGSGLQWQQLVPLNAPVSGHIGQIAPLPITSFPLQIYSDPCSFPPSHNITVNMPWSPPPYLPAGVYNYSQRGAQPFATNFHPL
ncbi:uncharacterized protein ACB058_000673 [Synchiropus picturatus]